MNMVRALLLVAFLLSSVFFAGCGEDAPPPPSPQPVKKAAPPVPKPKAPAEDAKVSEESTESLYAYDPAGRRDPFDPLLDVKRPVVGSDVPLTPLQRFDLGQLKLIGVIIGKGTPRAMVVAPGGKSFILQKGVKVGKNDGTVVDITQDGVMVEERYYDFSGEVRKNIQAIQLPQRQGVE